MSETSETVTKYFAKRGARNTENTLAFARSRADALNVNNIVVASGTGETGVKAAKIFQGFNLVVVAGAVGYPESNKTRMRDENRSIIERGGGRVLFAGHAFGMLGRAVKQKFGAIQIDELIAHVLRLFSVGVKVACEISCMAVDAGLIRSGSETIAIGGTGGGADTAIVIRPSNTHTFFDTRILEIICKPRG
jgi:hypothetical protein